MIRRLCIFILMMLSTAELIKAEQNTINTFLESVIRKQMQSDSLSKIGKYKEAHTKIVEARKIIFDASLRLTEKQINSLNIKMEFYKKKEADKLLQWKYDSLRIQTKIMEAKHKKALQNRKEAQHKIIISMDKERLELENQEVQLTKIINDNTKHEILKTQEKREIYIRLGILSMTLFVISLIGISIYMHQKRMIIYKLKIKKIKAEHARIASIRAKEEAEKAKEAANNSNYMKTTFIQNMSHEIRTPLNAIVGFSDLLSNEQQLEEEERNDLSLMIRNNSELLTNLINDIIDLTNLIGGYYNIKYSQFSIPEIYQDLEKTVKNRVPKDVELKLEQPEHTIHIETDKERVEQVLLNLCSNACKYTKAGSIILKHEITNNKGIKSIRFSVTDTGIGIPADKAETIFESFEKLDYFKQGNGLGLSICLMIAELLKGRCWLDTSYDKGARFYFEIPTGRP